MKLVEILARELEGWPEHAVIAVQDADKELKFSEEPGANIADGKVWVRNGFMGFAEDGRIDELADDFDTAIVTRAEWQDAADALKAKEVVEWDGVGLPPVGVSCERRFPDVRGSSWNGCIILAHGARRIFVRDNCGDEWAPNIDEVEFRPFRTPERIAAYELRAIIESGLDGRKTLDQVIEEIIGAGYRKQGQK